MELQGKTAFITGGASGIGFAMAKMFAGIGMKIALADINADDLSAAVQQLKADKCDVIGFVCDVADEASLRQAANETVSEFGKVHVLCNNAGVSRAGLVETISYEDWDWVIGVNFKGIIHGLRCLLPHMKAHGEPGHIVNTASMAGLIGRALSGPYCATKFAVVGLSEVLEDELKGSKIGVSVLCPSWVRTAMLHNGRNRPARFGGPLDLATDPYTDRNMHFSKEIADGLPPDEVAARVLSAIRDNRLYVLTHPNRVSDFESRVRRIVEDARGTAIG
ncbi:SDR family NAD(P)-dependent oxidoreductase [Bradyrhizobium sp. KBS0727]|uniref:SDR family NAD(P)-dependent oxidoreductase n=1 Tax=unclassified Bradyrhizobium TaxID=2631580 RepID=UPI00110EA9C8|nr:MULTISPECIES: SDR family NAD(P)-dependent oxidoreductase [unclassified Bradyrhizobium]QDW40581.1 SDR family NAD(P)-dependent oxidoreductase [Bradyrhizobium sp. KBS0725]QDW47186.1 SDR family NAD(P)-dependent oxidoreductase [Bradyrhizobium sp. KBS0727]